MLPRIRQDHAATDFPLNYRVLLEFFGVFFVLFIHPDDRYGICTGFSGQKGGVVYPHYNLVIFPTMYQAIFVASPTSILPLLLKSASGMRWGVFSTTM